MNARRRGGEQVIDEEDEEDRGDDRALGYTSIDRVQIAQDIKLSRSFDSLPISVTAPLRRPLLCCFLKVFPYD